MFKALFHKIGTATANYLMQEVESSPALTLNDFAAVPSREWLEFGWRSLRVVEPK
jgi:hypothetical protein